MKQRNALKNASVVISGNNSMMMIRRVSPPRGFPAGEEVIGHLVPIESDQWRAGRTGPWAVWRP